MARWKAVRIVNGRLRSRGEPPEGCSASSRGKAGIRVSEPQVGSGAVPFTRKLRVARCAARRVLVVWDPSRSAETLAT